MRGGFSFARVFLGVGYISQMSQPAPTVSSEGPAFGTRSIGPELLAGLSSSCRPDLGSPIRPVPANMAALHVPVQEQVPQSAPQLRPGLTTRSHSVTSVLRGLSCGLLNPAPKAESAPQPDNRASSTSPSVKYESVRAGEDRDTSLLPRPAAP